MNKQIHHGTWFGPRERPGNYNRAEYLTGPRTRDCTKLSGTHCTADHRRLAALALRPGAE